MVHETRVEVRANDRLGPEIFLLTVSAPEIAAGAGPGQFVMLQAGTGPEPLLRRPMSFCQAGPAAAPHTEADTFQILYQIVGLGTGMMARLTPGDVVSCLGPLGRGFRIPEDPSRPVVLVAGGIGVAPFPFLAERLRLAGVPWSLLYGARSERQLVGVDWFRELGGDTALVTEDGSAGDTGLVTDPLRRRIESDGNGMVVCACGPDPMLRAVAKLCVDNGVECQLSLEAMMPCGFGVCLGCCVPAAAGDGYLRICTDGPVFSPEEIRF
jgi:dihydroorotate dehydrogenase electron transfer subunit